MEVLKRPRAEESNGHNAAAEDHEIRALIVEFCKQFYTLGWVSGTGGGISVRSPSGRVYVAPKKKKRPEGPKHNRQHGKQPQTSQCGPLPNAGLGESWSRPHVVQKERISPEDLFVLDAKGETLQAPLNPDFKPSACTPLFMNAYRIRNAGAVIHNHSVSAVLATLLFPGNEFKCTHLEMIKGIEGHGYHDTLVVPIIENTAYECDLADSLAEAIEKYPKSSAVLVRRHGVYELSDQAVQLLVPLEGCAAVFRPEERRERPRRFCFPKARRQLRTSSGNAAILEESPPRRNLSISQAEISKIVSEISGDGGELEPSVHGLILLLHRWPFRIDLCVEIKRLLLSVLRVSNIPTHFAVSDFSVGASVLERLFQEQDNFSLVVEAHHFEQQTPTGRGIWLEDEDEENLDDDLKPADPNAAPEVSTFSVDDFFA
eukprot:tig00021319_g20246.t1